MEPESATRYSSAAWERPRTGLTFQVLVQRKIELQHVHARLAENAERAAERMLRNERAHLFDRNTTRFRDANGLKIGVARTDVRIQTGSGGGDGVRWNRRLRREQQR